MKLVRHRSMIALGCLCAAATTANVAQDSVPNLCVANEKPLFSCTSGDKTLSVCASLDLSNTSGYLHYRFGESPQHIELSYPKVADSPQKHFRLFTDGSAKASSEQLSFRSGAFTYTVYSYRAAFDFNGSGVFVKSKGKLLANFSCGQERPSPDDLYTLLDVGLPGAEYDDSIDDKLKADF
jgi:hypothetical protein